MILSGSVNGEYSYFRNAPTIQRYYVHRVSYVPGDGKVQWIWRVIDQKLHHNTL
jgi:hypothetical protein